MGGDVAGAEPHPHRRRGSYLRLRAEPAWPTSRAKIAARRGRTRWPGQGPPALAQGPSAACRTHLQAFGSLLPPVATPNNGSVAADFSSAQVKLRRAIEHLEDFERDCRAWLQSKPMQTRLERIDDQTDEVYVKFLSPIPDRLDAIYGDCVHNFRSVLDHVAVALAVDNGAAPGDTTVEFPISETYRAFFGYQPHEVHQGLPRWAGKYKIRHLGADAQSFIENLQPYQRPGTSWVLSELQYLDNRDKHRNVISNYAEVAVIMTDPPGVSTQYEPRLRLSDGAHVATINYVPGYTGPRGHPSIPAGLGIDRSNGIGWLDALGFLRSDLLPLIRDQVLGEAERRFS